MINLRGVSTKLYFDLQDVVFRSLFFYILLHCLLVMIFNNLTFPDTKQFVFGVQYRGWFGRRVSSEQISNDIERHCHSEE